MMSKKTLLAAAAVIGLTAGCGIEPDFPSQAELYDPPPEEEYPGFFVSTPRGMLFRAQVTERGILGMQAINIGRYTGAGDPAIRGVAFRRRVELKVQEGRVSGMLSGTLPVDLVSAREGGGLRFQGIVGGYPSDFRLDDRRLTGKVARCEYGLHREGERPYRGVARCAGNEGIVNVKVPPELRAWSDAELGAALGVLLGGV